MIKPLFLTATLLTLLTLSSQSMAWTALTPNYSCGKITSNKDVDWFVLSVKGWVSGYFTGVNEMTKTTWTNVPDEDSIFQALLAHCHDRPLDNVHEAATEVWLKIMKKQ